VSLVGAGAVAALSAEPLTASVTKAKIKAIAFDGLAVFDPRPIAALAERVFLLARQSPAEAHLPWTRD
jgi:hypothetical protein